MHKLTIATDRPGEFAETIPGRQAALYQAFDADEQPTGPWTLKYATGDGPAITPTVGSAPNTVNVIVAAPWTPERHARSAALTHLRRCPLNGSAEAARTVAPAILAFLLRAGRPIAARELLPALQDFDTTELRRALLEFGGHVQCAQPAVTRRDVGLALLGLCHPDRWTRFTDPATVLDPFTGHTRDVRSSLRFERMEHDYRFRLVTDMS